jgi:hypothetical protein
MVWGPHAPSRVGDRAPAITNSSEKGIAARRRKSEPDWHYTRGRVRSPNPINLWLVICVIRGFSRREISTSLELTIS